MKTFLFVPMLMLISVYCFSCPTLTAADECYISAHLETTSPEPDPMDILQGWTAIAYEFGTSELPKKSSLPQNTWESMLLAGITNIVFQKKTGNKCFYEVRAKSNHFDLVLIRI